jgi:hypothetical protein
VKLAQIKSHDRNLMPQKRIRGTIIYNKKHPITPKLDVNLSHPNFKKNNIQIIYILHLKNFKGGKAEANKFRLKWKRKGINLKVAKWFIDGGGSYYYLDYSNSFKTSKQALVAYRKLVKLADNFDDLSESVIKAGYTSQ